MSNNENQNNSKSKLVEILEQLINIFSADRPDRRAEVAKSAALTLLGIGALAGVEYLLHQSKLKAEKNKDKNA
jgi:hypothetical protein